ncbi:tropomodulin isoform X2 [Aethina tumida]|uniref:tropomodulin isoform X2 n=1 Tax=Aethina tumida TaxID=116153 RepID=UPI00096AE0CB|nr:tropomodulin isoform X2 [Aethina tumida]
MAETIEEEYETEFTKKTVSRTSFKIQETKSSTTTTVETTPAKLYGKDPSVYDDIDVDDLLSQLTEDEINMLAKEVDPDDSMVPPSQRCGYECDKDPTGPVDRNQLITFINTKALETPDLPENEPFELGKVRGKKWIPPAAPIKEQEADEQVAIDLGSEYENALAKASEEEIIDLAAILGFHSMMNQDQYYASLLNKGQPVGLGWDGITKSSKLKNYPKEGPNDTDIKKVLADLEDDHPDLVEVNLNNIKTISDENFASLFKALADNTYVQSFSLANTGLTDNQAAQLIEAVKKNNTLKVLNVESNILSPRCIVQLIEALLATKSIEEFRASNQRNYILGNKNEMEITELIEKNPAIVRLGLHLEYNDARNRIATHLQKNIDTIRKETTIQHRFKLYSHRQRPRIN